MGRIKNTKNKAEVADKIYQVSKDLINMVNCEEIKRKYSEEWGCSQTNLNWYITKAYALIESSIQKNVDRLLTRQTATLEKIVNDAINNNDRANALKGVDLINKLGNLYTEKQEVTISTDQPIQVSFGGVIIPTDSDDDNDGDCE